MMSWLLREDSKKQLLGFGFATAAFVLTGAILAFRLTTKPMNAFPQMILLAASMPICFYIMTVAPRDKAKRVGGILSCVIWVVGIALAFVIPPSSNFIYIPDAMLMMGFYPLLYLWKYSIPWLAFGVLNFGIGILLMVIEYSPDNMFPADLLKPKHHLAEYHPAVVWWVTGVFSTSFGIGRLIKNIVLMIRKKSSQST